MRVGQVYLWRTCLAVVTEGPAPPRRRGSTLTQAELDASPGLSSDLLPPDRQVYTLAVLHDSGGITWPVERLEDTLLKWEEDGRLAYP